MKNCLMTTIILLCALFINCSTNDLSFDAQEKNDWQMIDQQKFTFQLPPEMVPENVRGIDSFVGKYRSENMSVSFDYVIYSDTLENQNFPEYQMAMVTINEQNAKFVTYRLGTKDALTYVAAVHFDKVKASTESKGGTKLTLMVLYKLKVDEEIAKNILYSIKLTEPESGEAIDRENNNSKQDKQSGEISPDFFQVDLKRSTNSFAKAMLTSKDFPMLARLLNEHPERYAALMKHFEEERKKGNLFGWTGASMDPYSSYTDYLHAMTESSEEFARKQAIGWHKGWKLTATEVVPKLSTKNFPSTRRIAIEFLKPLSDGNDFGFDWRLSPDINENQIAIAKWQDWLKENSEAKTPANVEPEKP